MLHPPGRRFSTAAYSLRGSFPVAGSLTFSPVLRLDRTCQENGSRACRAVQVLPECRCGRQATLLPARCDPDRSVLLATPANGILISPRRSAGSLCDASRCWLLL